MIMQSILKNTLYLTLFLCTGPAFAATDTIFDKKIVFCTEFTGKPLQDFLLTNNPLIQNGQYSPDEQRQIRDTYNSFQPTRNLIVQDSKVAYKDFIQDPIHIVRFLRDPEHSPFRNTSFYADLVMDAITYTAIPTIEWLMKQNAEAHIEYHCALTLAEESGNPEILKLVYTPLLKYRANFLINRLNGALYKNNIRRFSFIFNCYSENPQTKKPITVKDLDFNPRNLTILSAVLTMCQPKPQQLQQEFPDLQVDTSTCNQFISDTCTSNVYQARENYAANLAKKRKIVKKVLKTVPETSRNEFDKRLLDHIVALSVPDHLDTSSIAYLDPFLEEYLIRLALKRHRLMCWLAPLTRGWDPRLFAHLIATAVPNYLNRATVNHIANSGTTPKVLTPIAQSILANEFKTEQQNK